MPDNEPETPLSVYLICVTIGLIIMAVIAVVVGMFFAIGMRLAQ